MKRLPDLVRNELGPTRDGPLLSSFMRGLSAGALIGAAIAGSALIQRRRTASHANESRDAGVAASIDVTQTAGPPPAESE